ncbi:outer membrane lipoprotein carrier protein LolA [Kitasatospora kazusensis]|uniref:Outer membrane lipoprotein carrier protein LolA n=1 Tax=Kitasatospora kazusensis TaxID=407974 RepID=A0ABN1ZLQ1_9ACTN
MLVPVGVVALAATGIGLVPALASDSAPALPSVTAEQLVAKALGSDVQSLSGTVELTTDLGVPTQLLGTARGLVGGKGRGGSSADPQSKLTELLGGEHTLQVAVDGPDRQRIGLIDQLAGYEVVHNGDQVWAWDSASNQAVHLTAPQHGATPHGAAPAEKKAPLSGIPSTPQEAARQFLTQSAATTSVTVDGTASVAGRKAYELSVKPRQSGSTIAEVRIAVDAANGVPLAVVVRSTGGSTVLDVHYSSVSFAKPDAKTFDFTVPKGAQVTQSGAGAKEPAKKPGIELPHQQDGLNTVGEGWTSVLSTKLPAAGPLTQPPAGLAAGTAKGRKHGSGTGLPAMDVQSLAKSLGKPVAGGTLISTKVLNVLITDDGRVFAGAVTLPVLQSAAGVK